MPDERMMKSFAEATTHFQAQKAAKEWFEGRNTPAANQARIKFYNYVNYLLFSGVEPSAEFAKLVSDIEAEVGLLKEKELEQVEEGLEDELEPGSRVSPTPAVKASMFASSAAAEKSPNKQPVSEDVETKKKRKPPNQKRQVITR